MLMPHVGFTEHKPIIRQAIRADTRLIKDIFRLEGGQYSNPKGSLSWSFPSLHAPVSRFRQAAFLVASVFESENHLHCWNIY